MRQVPYYVVIGNGRMATHLCYYFDCLAIKYHRWYRSGYTPSQLDPILSKATHALVLITDGAIERFIQSHILTKYPHLTVVHFSGCLVSTFAYSAHPLQTFQQEKNYALDEYRQIPFIIDKRAPSFSELLPGLDNPHYRIAKEEKTYYHAMCVLANNVSTLLWQKFYREMTARFDIRQKDLNPFLKRTFQNIQANPESALTGPIARQDVQTLSQDLNALQGDPFYSVFKATIDQFVLGAP